MDSSMDLKALHDEMLASMPSGASHSPEECEICAGNLGNENMIPSHGGEMSKTYTQEEVDSAVSEALEPLKKELQELKASSEQSELEARFSQEKADFEAQIKEIQGQLDTAVVEREASKNEYTELVNLIQSEAAAAEERAAADARKDERLTQVKEVASFPEEYLVANVDRWAAMSEEDFAAAIEDWKAVSDRREAANEGTLPKVTAMTAARESNASTSKAALREVLSLKSRGIDPRSIR